MERKANLEANSRSVFWHYISFYLKGSSGFVFPSWDKISQEPGNIAVAGSLTLVDFFVLIAAVVEPF